ncbi:MAG TPA: hypothetical protein VNZ86_11340, partial [Bacteroidia bacterium]|nr:hypothetical protein [Bacteroidia bacterium]
YARTNDNLHLAYDDATRNAAINNTSNPIRFNRKPDTTTNFPHDYDFFISQLSRELCYLKDRNLLSTDPASVVCSKTTQPDVNGILPACSTYLPNQFTNANSKGLFSCSTDLGIWQNSYQPYLNSPQPFYGQSDERFGLRYTVRTNGNQVIMIISNPTNFYLDMNTGTNTGLDFTNVANDMMRNAVSINVLFESSVNSYKSASYKTSRKSKIVLNGTSSPSLGVQTNIPLVNHKLNLQFAPYDVHVIEFVTAPGSPVNGYVDGWQKVWSNNGSSNMEDWHFASTDRKLVGDFDGNGTEDILMIQDPNIPTFSSWANMYTYAGNKWNWMWSNGGNDWIGSWNIREFDYYITGNFVKEASGPQKTEVLCIQKNDLAHCWAALYQYQPGSGTWTQLWSNSGSNWLGSWNLNSADKWIAGDFNNDGQDEIMSVAGYNSTGDWAELNTFSAGNWTNLWTNAYVEGTGKLGPWNITSTNQFYAGKYNGAGDVPYLLCFNGTNGTNQMLKYTIPNGPWVATPYINTTGSLGGI